MLQAGGPQRQREGVDAAIGQFLEVPPSSSFDRALRDTRAPIAGVPFDDSGKDSVLLADFRGKLDKLSVPAADKERLVGEAIGALNGPFRAAIESFLSGIESLRQKSPGPHGVWQLPGGADYYKNRIEFWTTDPSLTAQEIHRIGLREVARLRREMSAIMRARRFKGDLKDFFEFLRTDPDNFFPETEQGRQAFLAQSRLYVDAVYRDVHQYFNILPKAPLEVRRVEEWREATAPFAFYDRPSPDGSRPGIYYVNLRKMANRPKHEMETLAYHEGAPGHHLQVAIQQELDLPDFQKFAFFGAYSEGWACYTERMAKEHGRFAEPMQDFGRLQFDLLRSVRLVVDTGAHAKKWTRARRADEEGQLLINSCRSGKQAAKSEKASGFRKSLPEDTVAAWVPRLYLIGEVFPTTVA